MGGVQQKCELLIPSGELGHYLNIIRAVVNQNSENTQNN